MKRHLSILAALALVIVMVCSMASCDLINQFMPQPEPDHTHSYVDGKCECGESDPDYVAPHVHNFVDGVCECGESDPNYVPPHTHTFINGMCACGGANSIFVGDNVFYVTDDLKAFGYNFTTITVTTAGKFTINAEGGIFCWIFTDNLLTGDFSTDAAGNATGSSWANYGVNEAVLQPGIYWVGCYYYLAEVGGPYNLALSYAEVVNPYNKTLYAGNNTLVFSADEIEADAASRKLVIDEAASYKFASGNLFVSSVVDADGKAIARNEDYTYTLAAGEYTVNFSLLSMFGVAADTDCTLNVENPNAEPEEEDPVGPTGPLDTENSTLAVGDNTITVTAEDIELQCIEHTIVVTAEGTFVFSSNNLMVQVVTNFGPQMGEVYLVPGTYTVNVVTAYVTEAGDYNVTLTYTAPAGEDGGDGEQVGSEDAPVDITLPAENVAVNNDSVNMNWYTFTTTEAGTLTIVYSNDNSWVYVKSANETLMGDQEATLTFVLEANTTYKIALGTWNPDSGVTASISYAAGEVGGDDDDDTGALADKGDMFADEETPFDVTADDITAGGFTVTLYAVEAGEYNIYSNDLMVESVVCVDDGTVISRNDNWYFELQAYTQYTVTFSTQYVSNAGTYSAAAEYQYPEGHVNNPIWIYGLGGETVATYKGDFVTVWYTFYANANGVVTITTADTAARIMLMPVGGMEVTNYVDGEWTGSVSLTVMQGRQYLIGVIDANWSNEARDIAFTTALVEGEYVGDGSMNTPNVAVIGANTANVPAWDNSYFVYTATANGVLTLTSDNDLCSWTVTTEFGNWEFVDGTLTIALEMDQKAYIAVSTDDFSAAEIVFNASFKADPTNSWYEGEVIADGSAANAVTVADNTYVTLSFWGMGQYVITWDNADANVVLVDFFNGNTVLANGDVITGGNWGTDLMVYLNGYAAGTVNVTITPYVEESNDNVLVLGDNTIAVQDNQNGDTYNLPVNADETVTYVLTVGANGVLILSDGTVLFTEGSTTEITVPAGETASVSIGAYSWSDNVAVISVAVKEATAPGVGGDEPADTTGSANNPFVVNTIPGSVTVSGEHDVYIKFVAEKDCTVEFTYLAGCYVDGLPGNFVREDLTKKVYKGEVKAGDTFTINVYGGYEGNEYVYSFTEVVVEPPVDGGEDDGEEGGEAGDSTGTTVTYLGVGTNSRGMKVEINTTADTLVITRAQSGTLDDFVGGTSYTLVYSEMLAKADSTGLVSSVPGTNMSSITFDENGVVIALVWSAVTYSNFVQQ